MTEITTLTAERRLKEPGADWLPVPLSQYIEKFPHVDPQYAADNDLVLWTAFAEYRVKAKAVAP